MPALALDLAGDPPWNSLPLPDLEPDPDELNELEQLSLDPHSDAELLPEEEPDHEHCGERDLARLCLDGEHTAEMEGRPSKGSASVSLSICMGTVGADADGPALAIAAAPPPVLHMIASFKMSSASGTNPQMMGELLWYARFAGKEGSISRR